MNQYGVVCNKAGRFDSMKTILKCDKDCRFCKIFSGIKELGEIDDPIEKNKDFISIISVGSFIEGWVLIIPKSHVYSMKDIYESNSFIEIANLMIDKIKKVYDKKCIIFEHGANCEGSVTACGTNHAHIHVIPYDKSLLPDILRDNKSWIKCNMNQVKEIVKDKEYWLYGEKVTDITKAKVYIHIINEYEKESQYFRKILAIKEGIGIDKYDYKKYNFYETAHSSYLKLKE